MNIICKRAHWSAKAASEPLRGKRKALGRLKGRLEIVAGLRGDGGVVAVWLISERHRELRRDDADGQTSATARSCRRQRERGGLA